MPADKYLSSGNHIIDSILGGGFPCGKLVGIHGDEGVGKTTLVLMAAREATLKGGKTLYFDTEHALDPGYGIKLGLSPDLFYLVRPKNSSEILEIIKQTAGMFSLIAIDTLTALETCPHVSDPAWQVTRKLWRVVSLADSVALIINQIRGEGAGERAPGERALRYLAAHRIRLFTTQRGVRIENLNQKNRKGFIKTLGR